jgi:cathepsin L
MMKALCLVALLAVAAMAFSEQEYRAAFLKFIKDNNKHYAQADFAAKYTIFKANMDFVDAWNADAEHHRVAINKFADLTIAEFSAMYLGTRQTVTGWTLEQGIPAAAPASVDWRTKGAVTPIKNQEQCGSCWAFSAVGSTEGAHFLAKGALVSLSEQNLVDCSDAEGNQGCNGGLMTQAFEYIIKNKGIDTEASYPYTAQNGNCKFSSANIGSTLTGYTNVKSGSETDLVAKIVEGPTSVAIDASHSSFQLYSSGIYYEPACSATALDHGVLAVGYEADFYIVKNSWGTDWGMKGYIEMSRNKSNNCGIATMATIASDV